MCFEFNKWMILSRKHQKLQKCWKEKMLAFESKFHHIIERSQPFNYALHAYIQSILSGRRSWNCVYLVVPTVTGNNVGVGLRVFLLIVQGQHWHTALLHPVDEPMTQTYFPRRMETEEPSTHFALSHVLYPLNAKHTFHTVLLRVHSQKLHTRFDTIFSLR